MYIDFLIIVAGVAGLVLLAEVIVRNAVELARQFGLSGAFIGLSVLSVGTSIPELMTHVVGSYKILVYPEQMNDISGLLIGTNIGSDIFQQNFILPLVGLLGTIIVVRRRLFIEVGVMLGAAVLTWIFCLGGHISRLEGLILVLGYVVYLIYLFRTEKNERNSLPGRKAEPRPVVLSLLMILLAFIIMAVITERVVTASTELIRQLPISASFFGVVFLGISTSLPELTTALVSMYRREGGISVGILVGSNITNPMLGIGLGALISTYTVPLVIAVYDLPVNIATAALLYVFLRWREDLNKFEALVLLLLFFLYLSVRWLYFPQDFPVV